MFVCLCNGVSDRKIRDLVLSGQASDLRTLRRTCPAGGDCGKCIFELKRIINETKTCKPSSHVIEPLQKASV